MNTFVIDAWNKLKWAFISFRYTLEASNKTVDRIVGDVKKIERPEIRTIDVVLMMIVLFCLYKLYKMHKQLKYYKHLAITD